MSTTYNETRDGFDLAWQKCCCGIKAYASPTGSGEEPRSVGEWPFVDGTYEKSANHYGPAAVEKAREVFR